jgi:hypothetical protein
VTTNLAVVFDASAVENAARLREMRMAALLLLWSHHSLTRALAAAIGEPRALGSAVIELGSLTAIPKR